MSEMCHEPTSLVDFAPTKKPPEGGSEFQS